MRLDNLILFINVPWVLSGTELCGLISCVTELVIGWLLLVILFACVNTGAPLPPPGDNRTVQVRSYVAQLSILLKLLHVVFTIFGAGYVCKMRQVC